MKSRLFAVFAALFAATRALADPTPLFMQIDRSLDPSPICANRTSTATGCQVIGYMSSGGVFTLPANTAFTGIPTAPTAAPGTNTTQVATTAFVAAMGALKAPLADPTFTGVPRAPTAAADTNTTQLATTAYYIGQASALSPIVDGTATIGTSYRFARADHIHPTDTSRAAVSALGVSPLAIYAGYDPTGATDSASALGLCFTALTATGGVCQASPLDKIKISSNITIPKNVTLSCGLPSPGMASNTDATFASNGGIRLSSAASITSNGGAVQDCQIYRDGMTFPASNSSAFAGTAIICGGYDVSIRNVLILGFAIAIDCSSTSTRLFVENARIDANYGIKACASADSAHFYNIHIWPYATVGANSGSPSDAALQRTGTGFEICGLSDDTHVDNVLSGYHTVGFNFSGNGNVQIGKIWSDYTATNAGGSIGVYFSGSFDRATANQIYAYGEETPVIIANTGGWISIDNLFASGFATTTATQTLSASCVSVNSGHVIIKYLRTIACSTYALNIGSAVADVSVLSGRLEGIGAGTSAAYIAAPASATTAHIKIANDNIFTDQVAGTSLVGGNPIALTSVASAANVALPSTGNIFKITGVDRKSVV